MKRSRKRRCISHEALLDGGILYHALLSHKRVTGSNSQRGDYRLPRSLDTVRGPHSLLPIRYRLSVAEGDNRHECERVGLAATAFAYNAGYRTHLAIIDLSEAIEEAKG